MNNEGVYIHTFETRLKFISSIFSNLFTQDEILQSCITHKLNRTYEQYLADLGLSINILAAKNKPVRLLKQLSKGE